MLRSLGIDMPQEEDVASTLTGPTALGSAAPITGQVAEMHKFRHESLTPVLPTTLTLFRHKKPIHYPSTLVDYLQAATGQDVTVEKLVDKVKIQHAFTAAAPKILGFPSGRHYIGLPLIPGNEMPLHYHTVGAQELHIWGGPEQRKLIWDSADPSRLRDALQTKSEPVALATIRSFWTRTGNIPFEKQAEVITILAEAVTTRKSCSSACVELINEMSSPFVRHLLSQPQRPERFSPSKILDLGKLLGPEGVDLGSAPIRTRRAETVTIDGWLNRVKDIAYGNAAAATEVAAAKFYALTGLDCPDSRLAWNAADLFGGFDSASRVDFQDHQHDDSRFCVVASPVLTGFRDLGLFVMDREVMVRLIEENRVEEYDQAIALYNTAQARYDFIVNETTIDTYEGDRVADLQQAHADQLKAMQTAYSMLPKPLRDETAKAYLASTWIGNWDFVNFGLANFGFYREEHSGRLRAATVDFGNSLQQGFGGRQKQNSWDTIGKKKGLNDRARPDDPMLPVEVKQAWAGTLKFSDPLHAKSVSDIGNLPRMIPIAPLIAPQIQAETTHGIGGPLAPDTKEMVPFFEAAYRISLIPDEAIFSIAMQHWPWDDEADVEFFPRHKMKKPPVPGREEDPPQYMERDAPGYKEMAQIMMQRRDDIAGRFDFDRFVERHPLEAKHAYDETFAAVLGLTGFLLEPKKPSAPALRPSPFSPVQMSAEEPVLQTEKSKPMADFRTSAHGHGTDWYTVYHLGAPLDYTDPKVREKGGLPELPDYYTDPDLREKLRLPPLPPSSPQ